MFLKRIGLICVIPMFSSCKNQSTDLHWFLLAIVLTTARDFLKTSTAKVTLGSNSRVSNNRTPHPPIINFLKFDSIFIKTYPKFLSKIKILISSEQKKRSTLLGLFKLSVYSMCIYVQYRQHYFTKIKDLFNIYHLLLLKRSSFRIFSFFLFPQPPINNIRKKSQQ